MREKLSTTVASSAGRRAGPAAGGRHARCRAGAAGRSGRSGRSVGRWPSSLVGGSVRRRLGRRRRARPASSARSREQRQAACSSGAYPSLPRSVACSADRTRAAADDDRHVDRLAGARHRRRARRRRCPAWSRSRRPPAVAPLRPAASTNECGRRVGAEVDHAHAQRRAAGRRTARSGRLWWSPGGAPSTIVPRVRPRRVKSGPSRPMQPQHHDRGLVLLADRHLAVGPALTDRGQRRGRAPRGRRRRDRARPAGADCTMVHEPRSSPDHQPVDEAALDLDADRTSPFRRSGPGSALRRRRWPGRSGRRATRPPPCGRAGGRCGRSGTRSCSARRAARRPRTGSTDRRPGGRAGAPSATEAQVGSGRARSSSAARSPPAARSPMRSNSSPSTGPSTRNAPLSCRSAS